MLKNYLKTAWRAVRKHKGYSCINIAGLTIGMAVCLFILLWVKDEASYDQFHTHIDHLYRLTQDQSQGGGQ